MFSNDKIQQIGALSFLNFPFAFEDICFIHPISVESIISLDQEYDKSLQLLTINRIFIKDLLKQKDIQISNDNELNTISPLAYLMKSCQVHPEIIKDLEKAFLIFIKEKATILYDLNKIVIGDYSDKRILDETNFSDFQNVIRIQNKIPIIQDIPENEDPRAKRFRELREYRDFIKLNQKNTDKDSADFLTLMSVLCSSNCNITPFNIKQLSIYSFYSLLNINMARERYDVEMNYLYAGADSKKLKPKHYLIKDK